MKEGKATEEEDQNLANDAPKIAKKQVNDFDRTTDKTEQQRLEECNALIDPTAKEAPVTPGDFIKSNMQTQELGVHYVSVV